MYNNNCVQQYKNPESAIGIKLRKSHLKFDNVNAVFKTVTVHINNPESAMGDWGESRDT